MGGGEGQGVHEVIQKELRAMGYRETSLREVYMLIVREIKYLYIKRENDVRYSKYVYKKGRKGGIH